MQENLARGLQVVSRAVSARSTLPVLANVLLRTEDGGLKLTATNLEIGISTWVPGKIEHEGALTVPARLITDVVNGLAAGERIDLEVEGGTTLHLRSGRAQARIRGIDADEFPVVPTAGERPPTKIAQKTLRHALSEVVFAAAPPNMTTVTAEPTIRMGDAGVIVLSHAVFGPNATSRNALHSKLELEKEQLLRLAFHWTGVFSMKHLHLSKLQL